MNRTELFDKLLQNRLDNPNGFLSMLTLSEREFDTTDENMVESIVDEMIENNWVEPSNHSKFDVKIKYDGQQVIEKFGSYSSFLRSENVAQKKAQRRKITPVVIKIGIAIIFGLSTAILGWLNYIDNKKIDNQQTEIEALEKTIDSLQTELKKRHTTTAIIQRGDSTKTKDINNN
ncbi:hypothetical protein [Nonlabens sp. Asnod3-H03]|uniref:hypothetical protein n=1 Tax=Nonlabens sp. Asnod3-H03 TaxID=3160580 RepID=UPI00386BDBA8